MAQAGRSPRFSVCELWQVQNIPDACRTCSADLCIVFLLFQERRKEVKKIIIINKGSTAFQQAGQQLPVCSSWASRAVMCYKKLI
jgi:hypothetical protein